MRIFVFGALCVVVDEGLVSLARRLSNSVASLLSVVADDCRPIFRRLAALSARPPLASRPHAKRALHARSRSIEIT